MVGERWAVRCVRDGDLVSDRPPLSVAHPALVPVAVCAGGMFIPGTNGVVAVDRLQSCAQRHGVRAWAGGREDARAHRLVLLRAPRALGPRRDVR